MLSLPDKRRTLVLPAIICADSPVPVAFFDADQTLRKSKTHKPSPEGAEDCIVFEECADKLKELSHKGYILAIVSNQAGVGLGKVSKEQVESAMQETIGIFSNHKVFFNYYDYADKYDNYRKPNIGMAKHLETELKAQGYELDWNASFMVGDAAYKRGKDLQPNGEPGRDHSNADRLFAENITKTHKGFKFYYALDYFGLTRERIKR
jgi:bifunctional polynucleotide phosphatase/kinase